MTLLMGAKTRAVIVLLACCHALARQASAQPNVDLTAVNLEDLLKIEVRSVSKKEQQLFQTPAAVYVLTNEEIRRSGVTTIPDALRLVPGLQVAQIDGNKWAVSARGSNSTWSNKLLVLVDGRVVYTPVSSGVYWDLQDFPLEDVERIEVIRGPGAALWGANAVNGVINVISKSADATRGALVSVSTGSLSSIASVRYGGSLGKRGAYRLFARHSDRGELIDDTGADAADDSRMTQLGFRMDVDTSAYDSFTVQGAALNGESGQRIDERLTSYVPGPPRPIISSDSPARVRNLLARWTHTHSGRSSVSVQAFWDKSYRLVVGKGEWTETVDLELQNRFGVGKRHDIVWGAGQRFWWDREEVIFAEYFSPSSSRTLLFNAFVQDEIAVATGTSLTVGSKFERNSRSGFEFQPTVRLTWLPRPTQTAWVAVSRAARTPSRVEQALHVDYAVIPGQGGIPMVFGIRGSSAVRNEHTNAYEVGYRVEPRKNLTFDVAAFYNAYDDLRTIAMASHFETEPGPPHVAIFQEYVSGMGGESQGVELLARWQPHTRWRLDASYDWLRSHFHDTGNVENALLLLDRNPEHQFRLKSWLTVVKGWQLDSLLLYVGRLQSVDVPAYTRADVRFGGPITRGINVSVVGQNLLKAQHREFDGFEGVYFSNVRRSGAVQLTVTF